MSWSAQAARTIPQMRWLKQQTFITVLETGKSKIKELADLVPGEGPPGFQTDVFLLSRGGERIGGRGP